VKTLIFSDTHFSAEFEPARYRAIIRLIKSVDRVIINGDFWDSYLTTFDNFINSEWQRLFPLLKEKQTVYIYGNHDRPNDCDLRVGLFSTQQAADYILETKKQTFLIEHGHVLAKEFEESHPAITKCLKGIYPWLDAQTQGVGLVGLLYQQYHEYRHHRLWQKMLHKLANNPNWLTSHKQLLVGHCHHQMNDAKLRIQSLGSFRWGFGRYAIIDQKSFKIFETRYS